MSILIGVFGYLRHVIKIKLYPHFSTTYDIVSYRDIITKHLVHSYASKNYIGTPGCTLAETTLLPSSNYLGTY